MYVISFLVSFDNSKNNVVTYTLTFCYETRKIILKCENGESKATNLSQLIKVSSKF